MDTNGTTDLKPGEALFSVGDLSDSVYLVMSGSLFVEQLSSAKGQQSFPQEMWSVKAHYWGILSESRQLELKHQS